MNENIKESLGLMAAMLKIDFNIDPLTIDQQDLLEENNDPYYNCTNVKEQSIYVSNKGFFSEPNQNHKVDMGVFFPRTKYINGRPNWLTYDKNGKYYFASLEQIKLVYPIMISAYHKGEDISIAVPADIIEIGKPNDKIGLVLNKWQYTLQVRDVTGNVIEQTVQVK